MSDANQDHINFCYWLAGFLATFNKNARHTNYELIARIDKIKEELDLVLMEKIKYDGS